MSATERITERIKAAWNGLRSDRKKLMYLGAAGAAGVLLILVPVGRSEKNTPDEDSTAMSSVSADVFCENEERRLTDLLSSIEGVGKAKVMITYGGSEKYTYAENIGSGRKEREYVLMKNGSSEQALVTGMSYPEITGVVVVCEGGGSDRVREDVYRTVTAALGISSAKVYVARMD